MIPRRDETGLADRDERRAEVDRRLGGLRELLADSGASGLLLACRRNFSWATAGGVNHVVLTTEEGVAPLLVTADDALVLAPINESARIEEEELAGLPYSVVTLDWFDRDGALAEARMRAGRQLLLDADVEEAMRTRRSVLAPLEQRRLAWLGGRVRAALGGALRGLIGGESEEMVAAELVAALGRDGVRAPVVLAAADDRIARYRHPLPTVQRIERRLMLVVVAERWGLHVAATRFRELERTDAELAERIEAVAAVHQAMVDATEPGATLGDVIETARRAYADAGFPDEWRLHHQGGSIGYQGRERIAVPGDATPVTSGMAFAWNPSIAGAKAEETFIVGDDGSRSVVTA